MFRKKLASLALAAFLSLGMTTGAFAQENIKVQLNGSNLSFNDTKPIFENNSTYVPLKETLEAMGASVSYDENTQTYTAKKDTTTITYKEGDTKLTIEKDGKSETKDFEAPTGYIPTRIATEALDYSVSWDSANKTISIADKNAALPQLDGEYTIMDKYLAYQREFLSKPLALKGTFDINYEVNTGETTIPLSATGTIDAITDGERANMEMAMKFDTSKLIELTDNISAEEIQQMNTMLGDIKMNFIFDLSTGKYYINSPIFAQSLGTSEDTWIMVDLNDMLKQTGMGNSNFSLKDMVAMSKSANFQTYMDTIMSVNNTDQQSAEKFTTMITQLFSDSAFEKEGNTYHSSYSIAEDDTTVGLNMYLTEENDKITGYSFDMAIGDSETSMKMTTAQSGNKITANISFNIKSLLNMIMNLNMEYSETSETPVSAPSSDNIISFPFSQFPQ